jgi:hypothetical protein
MCDSGQLEQLDFSERRREHAVNELRHLHARSNRVAVAITMLYMAFSAFAATSMTIAISSLIGHYLAGLPVIFAIAGVGLLLIACVNLVFEARNSLQGNDREVKFFYELENLRAEARKEAE